MRPAIALAVVVGLTGVGAAAAWQQASSPQAPPVIRSQITLVPIDVRVIGRDGAPVTDLTEADFTILEDGVPQTIRHFSRQAFTADAAAVSDQPEFRRALDDEARTSNRRVFLILLGRGRHQAVSTYVDGLRHFVTEQLLPQDQVAVMAWNRATDFTSDHARIAGIIDRFREIHPKIESDLRMWFSGLQAVVGSRDIPPHVQRSIDKVFDGEPGLRPRALTPSPQSDASSRDAQARRAGEEIQRDEIMKTFQGTGFITDMRSEILAALAGMSFEEYVEHSIVTLQDIGNLYAAIDYLRYLEGEKHILLLTEKGLDMPLMAGNRGLARIASDARIAIDVLQTGGVVGAAPARVVQGPNGSNIRMSPLPTFGAVVNQGFSVRDLREVADVTGGHMMAYRKSEEAFRGLEKAIGFQYLLAYTPSKPATDGSFRDVEIKVKRPDVKAQYRRGYFASPRLVPLDRRDFVTFNRIRAAAQYGGEIPYIKVAIDRAAPAAEGRAYDVTLKIDVSRLAFTTERGVRTAALDLALYFANAGRNPVGESLSRVDLAFTDEAYASALKDGARVTLSVPLTAGPRYLKVVVYDYGADLLGTATRKFGS